MKTTMYYYLRVPSFMLSILIIGSFFTEAISIQKNQKEKPTTTQQTLALIKPNAVAVGHTGDIIKTIERNGLSIVKMKKFTIPKEKAQLFYAEHKGKPFFDSLMQFMTSGPIVAMLLEGDDAIKAWRTLMGATDPVKAAPGTIRKMYALNKQKNAVHGSSTPEAAQKEIAIIFGK